MKNIIKIRLSLPQKISTNAIYAGIHWTVRKKHKDLFKKRIIPLLGQLKQFNFPVMRFNFYFKKNALDHSNCSYMAKILEDCIVEYGLIENDSPEYVDYISIKAHKIEKGSHEKEDYVVLMIENKIIEK